MRPTTQPLLPFYHFTRTLACPRKPDDVVRPAYNEMISDLPAFLRYPVCSCMHVCIYRLSCQLLYTLTKSRFSIPYSSFFYGLSIVDSRFKDCVVCLRFSKANEHTRVVVTIFELFYVSTLLLLITEKLRTYAISKPGCFQNDLNVKIVEIL